MVSKVKESVKKWRFKICWDLNQERSDKEYFTLPLDHQDIRKMGLPLKVRIFKQTGESKQGICQKQNYVIKLRY